METAAEEFDSHQSFAEAAETLLLGGARTLSPNDLAEKADIDLEFGRRLWRSMGFAIAEDDDEVALTNQDLAAIHRVQRAIDLEVVTAEEVVSLARLTGQVFAQLAETEGDALFRIALANSGTDGLQDVLKRLAGEILPLVDGVHSYVWRRQLAAYVARKVAQHDKNGTDDSEATVGFADIAGYTSFSRHASESDLASLLELFESVATDAVGAHSGRVVKLIGDAVLFTAADPVHGANIACDLLASWPATQPPLRAGVASGPILRRLGDIFGPTVNIASRLISLGDPGQIRIDEATSTALETRSEFRLAEQEPQDVRGYDQLRSWWLTRSADPESRAASRS